jgi:DNA-binding transcriptional ArsR family regulator
MVEHMSDTTPWQITEAKTLAAMTHPVRRRLLNMLKLDGPATASVLAQRTGQAVGNVSHHLRVLADAALIEEVPELARDRRERWWRRTASAFRWNSTDFAADTAADTMARAADTLNLDYQVTQVRQWAQVPDEEHARWPDGPFSTDSWLRVTDSELGELAAELIEVITRWADRPEPDDGQDRSSVFVFARGVPGQL